MVGEVFFARAETSRASCLRGWGLWHRVVGGWEQRALEGSPASGRFATRAGTDLTVACGFCCLALRFFNEEMAVFFGLRVYNTRLFAVFFIHGGKKNDMDIS